MFLITQSVLIVLVSAVLGFFLGYWFYDAKNDEGLSSEELRPLQEERDELERQMTAGAGTALPVAINARKAAALEAELAELRSRADELAAANARLREGEGVDEDIAALKWRNKYLEARVLFFEGRDPGGSVETPPMPGQMTTTRLVEAVELAPIAAIEASEPKKPGRKKDAAVRVLEPVVEPVAVAAPPVEKRKVKAIAPAPPPPKPVSNEYFTPSPLAGLSSDALEQAIALVGAGKPPPRSRRRSNPDELLLIDGVGPKNKAWLNDQGIYYFYQIATMNIDQVAWLSKNLPTFGARVYRENWVAQCTSLARGGSAGA
jgi:predicted flap endonuclease-1-like 5' DNA nuclease